MTKSIKSITALLLLACCAFAPGCDLLERNCDPNVEICEFTGQHPGTLAPRSNK